MKQYINTSNYYLGVLTTVIDDTSETGTFEVDSVENDHVTLPVKGFYWLDVDFQTTGEREIFRITGRAGNTLTYDKRISPTGKFRHEEGAVVGLRDFSELFNSLSSNTDNFGQVEQISNTQIKVYGGNVFVQGGLNRQILTRELTIVPNNGIQYLHFDSTADSGNEYVFKNTQDPYLFLIAGITTDTSLITGIEDLRGIFLGADLGFLRLDGSTPMEGNLDMNGHNILNASINPIVPTADANSIAGFDGDKKLVSLNSSTYPNLTELSYLKGVTSNVQNQINSKGDMAYQDYNFQNYAVNTTYYIEDLSINIVSSQDFRLKAGSNLQEGQQYIVRASNSDGESHMVIFQNGISGPANHLVLQPMTTTTISFLATSPISLEWHSYAGVTSVNGQTGDVIIDLSSVMADTGESGVKNLYGDVNLWELEAGLYKVGEHPTFGAGYPATLFFNHSESIQGDYGDVIVIEYDGSSYSPEPGIHYTIIAGESIHAGFADYSSGNDRYVPLLGVIPIELTYSANLEVNCKQSLNYVLTLTGDCNISFANVMQGCVYSFIIIQDSVGGHALNLPVNFFYASGYAQDTTAYGVSKLIIDYQDGMWFASITRYQGLLPL